MKLSKVQSLLNYFPLFEHINRKSPSYSDSITNNQKDIRDMLIDDNSLQILNSINIDEYRVNRIIIYKIWENFSLTHGLKPVFNKFKTECMPWVFPAYASDIDERNKWLDWGYNNNINLFTWPRLPHEVATEEEVLKRWKRLLCFPIEPSMKPAKLEKYLSNEK